MCIECRCMFCFERSVCTCMYLCFEIIVCIAGDKFWRNFVIFFFFFFFVFFFPGRIFPTVHCRYLTESYHIRINICRRIDAYYRVTAGEFSQVLSHVCLCDIHAVYANLLKVIVARNSKVLIFQLIKFSLFVSVIFPTRFSLTNLLIFQNASC